MNRDSRNNLFTDFEDTRLTLVLSRDPGTDWAGSPVLRIQKYSDPPGSQSLRPGPEIPFQTNNDIIQLVIQILKLAQQMP